MLGEMSPAEIEAFLTSEIVARLGCHSDGRTYVVPITYAYNDGCVIGHSAEGLKIWMMRANRDVCVEVDHMDNPANWTCVIARGRYEELKDDEAQQAMALLKRRFAPLITSATAAPSHGTEAYPPDAAGKQEIPRKKAVVYRIRLTEKSGRFERRVS